MFECGVVVHGDCLAGAPYGEKGNAADGNDGADDGVGGTGGAEKGDDSENAEAESDEKDEGDNDVSRCGEGDMGGGVHERHHDGANLSVFVALCSLH